MSSYAETQIEKFRSKGVLVDTNLLILLLVGQYDLKLLGANGFKRTRSYTSEDFELLVKVLSLFVQRVTTPHILTEVSNLASQLPEEQKVGCLSKFVSLFEKFNELECDSLTSARRDEFPRIGLTDSVIADASSQFLVLTDDARFVANLAGAGIEALNFNHIRTLQWTQ